MVASTDNPGTIIDTTMIVLTTEGSSDAFSCGVCVGGNDDGGTGTTSEVSFSVVGGQIYHVLVFGKGGGGQGKYELTVTVAP
jgi:hypothetical protein